MGPSRCSRSAAARTTGHAAARRWSAASAEAPRRRARRVRPGRSCPSGPGSRAVCGRRGRTPRAPRSPEGPSPVRRTRVARNRSRSTPAEEGAGRAMVAGALPGCRGARILAIDFTGASSGTPGVCRVERRLPSERRLPNGATAWLRGPGGHADDARYPGPEAGEPGKEVALVGGGSVALPIAPLRPAPALDARCGGQATASPVPPASSRTAGAGSRPTGGGLRGGEGLVGRDGSRDDAEVRGAGSRQFP